MSHVSCLATGVSGNEGGTVSGRSRKILSGVQRVVSALAAAAAAAAAATAAATAAAVFDACPPCA